MLLRRLARPLLAAAFVVDGIDTLRRPDERVKTATELLQRGQRGLPSGIAERLPADPAAAVRLNAAAQVGGGLFLALGRAPRMAAVVLAATVVPATVTEQDFWNEQDPARKSAKRTALLKDLGLLGGLLIAAADTEGKPSLAWRSRRAAQDTAAAVSAALPFSTTGNGATGDALRKHANDAAERAREIGAAAASKSAELAETAQQYGPEWAETAKERGSDLAETALVYGSELTEVAKERSGKLAELAKQRSAEWAEQARERGTELAEQARERSTELAELAKQRGPEIAEAARERRAYTMRTARDKIEARRR
ncbi:DoxX family membrane protein [Nocardia sp. 004]|uniref:DoxX family membrane protein n=1 Tax=Nocardia sp. 004 TaxID=3385978 RepID=UPI00399F96B2